MDSRANDIGTVHLCFRTDNIQDVYDKSASQGANFHCPSWHIGPGWVTYFRDPDGIIL